MAYIPAKQLLITFVPAIFVLVVMMLASVLFQVSIPAMTRDIADIAKVHPLRGLLSNLGVLLWCAAASICFFSAITLRHNKPGETFWFLLLSALLSAYLLFDDFFLIHERLAPRYLGLREKTVFMILGMAVSAYLIAFRRVILRTHFGVLLLALGFLGTSVILDVIFAQWLMSQLDKQWEYFLEDGAKWLGIVSWCSYYVHTSHQFLVNTFGLTHQTVQSTAHSSLASSHIDRIFTRTVNK